MRPTSIVTGVLLAALAALEATPAGAQSPARVATLARGPAIQAALASARSTEARTIDDQIRFCEVPAPPFMEAARGELLRRAFVERGCSASAWTAWATCSGIGRARRRGRIS